MKDEQNMLTYKEIKAAQKLRFTKKYLNSKAARKAMSDGLIEGLE